MQPEEVDHPGAVAPPQGNPHREVQDEAGHGMYLYGAAESPASSGPNSSTPPTIGQKYSSIFNCRRLMGGNRCDRMARRRRRDRQSGSALPLLLRTGRAMVRIY